MIKMTAVFSIAVALLAAAPVSAETAVTAPTAVETTIAPEIVPAAVDVVPAKSERTSGTISAPVPVDAPAAPVPAPVAAPAPVAPVVAAPALVAPVVAAPVQIVHDQLAYIVPGKRTTIKATVTDPQGTKLVRCYFRIAEGAEYLFVPMTPVPGAVTRFQGTLPAMSVETKSIEYRLLTVNQAGTATKSQPFMTLVKAGTPPPAWQEQPSGDAEKSNLILSGEQASGYQNAAGISDNISLNIIESTARYIAVAGSTATISSAFAAAGTTAATAGTVATSATVTGTQAVGSAVVSGAATTGKVAATTTTSTVSAGTLAAVAGGIVAVGVFNMNTNAGSANGLWTFTVSSWQCSGTAGTGFYSPNATVSLPISSSFDCSKYNDATSTYHCSGGISGSQINFSMSYTDTFNGNTSCTVKGNGSVSSGTFTENCTGTFAENCTGNWTNGSFSAK